MATPLYEALQAHIQRHRCSYHTPGHKTVAACLQPLMNLAMDVTELPDTGSLYDGGDAVEEAELAAAETFGAAQTHFSAGGCTLCMQTMLALAAKRGNAVLMGRNAHRAAVHAAALLDLDVYWTLTHDPKAVEEALEAHPQIKTVYITSPDYYGRLADVEVLANVCHRREAALLVDNAHGSHLGAFACHPLSLGADMTADSAHKTLPVLTGGAYLHLSKNGLFADLPRETVKATMALFGSTSPSFPVLASLDIAQDWWAREGQTAFVTLCDRAKALFWTAKMLGLDPQFERCDPVRLTLDCGDGDAEELAARLRAYGHEAEYADRRYAVFLLSPFHSDAQLHALQNDLKKAVQEPLAKAAKSPFSAAMPSALPKRRCRIRQAAMAPCETVPLSRASGRVSAHTVCPCPPGVAAVVSGEEISPTMAQLLQQAGYESVAVLCE